MRPEITIGAAAMGEPMVCIAHGLRLGHGLLFAHSTGSPAGAIDPEGTGE